MISIIQYVLSAYKISGKRNDIYKILFSGPTFHRLESDLTGLPDTIGQLADNSRFSFARIYMQPNITYKTRDINVELGPTTEYLYEKYSHDNGHHQMLFMPDLSIRWYVTPRLRFSLGGSASVEPLDASRFYRTVTPIHTSSPATSPAAPPLTAFVDGNCY
ncbi:MULTISPECIES: hypothetical protein [Segatella]|nr:MULTISPECIES: hypothetical protein [Segatella]UKK79814.1 hypothetical protein L6469_11715 [Segatella baroniae B14]